MRKPTIAVSCALLLLPFAASADQHVTSGAKERKFIIRTTDEAELPRLMEELEARTGELDDVEFEVIVDSDGPHRGMRQQGRAHGRMPMMHMVPPMPPMSSKTAQCIIKHLSKIQSDGAAGLLLQACRVISEDAGR